MWERDHIGYKMVGKESFSVEREVERNFRCTTLESLNETMKCLHASTYVLHVMVVVSELDLQQRQKSQEL